MGPEGAGQVNITLTGEVNAAPPHPFIPPLPLLLLQFPNLLSLYLRSVRGDLSAARKLTCLIYCRH